MGKTTKDLILGTGENANGNGGGAADTPQLPAAAATSAPMPSAGEQTPVMTGRAARGYDGAEEEAIPAAPMPSAGEQTPAGTAPAGTGATEQKPKRKSYVEMYREMTKDDGGLTDAEKKRMKREQILSSIGDAISAFSNLYFTGKGALNAYSGQNTAVKETTDRWDKIAKEREAKRKEYYNGLFQMQQIDDANAARDRAEERQERLDKENAEKAEREQKRKDDVAASQTAMYNARAAGDLAKAAYYDAYAKAREMGASSDAALKSAQAAYYDAKKGTEHARAQDIRNGGTGRGGSGGKNKKTYSVYNPETGKDEVYDSQDKRDRRAAELGYDLTPDAVETRSGYDRDAHQRVTTRSGSRSTAAKLGQQEGQRKAAKKPQTQQKSNNSGVKSRRLENFIL